MINSLKRFVESSMKRRRLYGKHTTQLGAGKAYIQNHDDTGHAEMSYMDVESWMSSTQNKDDLIQNLFKRQNFKEWLRKTYGNVDEAHVYRTLHEFTPEALATITSEEATQVFEALVLDDLSDDQLVELVAAVQDAPTEIRAAFEESIDIFGSGAVDTYVPIGSTVPVKTRRALIAIGAVASVAPALKRRK
jgi:hypothetical protein